MTYRLIIDGRLPGLNDYQLACRSHYQKGGKMKKQQVAVVSMYILQQLKDVHIDKKVEINYKWYEQNKKRDLDNVSSFGRKCIQDALVETGVLKNDGWKNIIGFSDKFYIDKENPRIEVEIIESENNLDKE